MDSQTYHLLTQIRERTYDLCLDSDAGRRRAEEVRGSLMSELDAIRQFIPRREALDCEVLIERKTGWKR